MLHEIEKGRFILESNIDGSGSPCVVSLVEDSASPETGECGNMKHFGAHRI